MAAKPVVKGGIRWLVGDGRSIKTWEDAWIPSMESGRVLSPRPEQVGGICVANLLVHSKAEWNVSLVNSAFLPHEAEAILSIPISPITQADTMVWGKTPQWHFLC